MLERQTDKERKKEDEKERRKENKKAFGDALGKGELTYLSS